MMLTKKSLIRLSQLQRPSKTSNHSPHYTLQELYDSSTTTTLESRNGFYPGECAQLTYPSMCLFGFYVGVVRYDHVMMLQEVSVGQFSITLLFQSITEAPRLIPPIFLMRLPHEIELPQPLTNLSQSGQFMELMRRLDEL